MCVVLRRMQYKRLQKEHGGTGMCYYVYKILSQKRYEEIMLKKGEILDGIYQVGDQIGKGGGGVVYRARHIRLDTDVVIKQIREEAKGKLEMRAEADILKNLKHSYVPHVMDFSEKDGDVYTVMEYIEGKNFSQLMREGEKFSQQRVIKWAGQLCEALEYLHKQKPPIIHSDIKPGNIMLTPDDNICLIDFNISQVFNRDGTSVVGQTDGYAPPEQYQTYKKAAAKTAAETEDDATAVDEVTVVDETDVISDVTVVDTDYNIDAAAKGQTSSAGKNVYAASNAREFVKVANMDPRSDIYSLGASLYHLLSGKRPKNAFENQTPISQLVPDISEGLRYIIETAMQRDIDKRFASATEMLTAIKNIHKLDSVYKAQKRKQTLTNIITTVMFVAFAGVTALGVSMIGQSRAADYEALVDMAMDNAAAYNLEEAQNYAGQALEKFPNNIGSHYVNALVKYYAQDYAGTADYIVNYLQHPVHAAGDEIDMQGNMYYLLGNSYMELGQYQESLRAFDQAIAKNPGNVNYYRDCAIATARSGDYKAAEEILQQAESKNMDSTSLMLVEGEIAMAAKDYNKVYLTMEQIMASSADNNAKARAAVMAADAAQDKGDYGYAAQILESAKSTLPQQSTVMVTETLGEVYARMAQPANVEYTLKAIECFEELLQHGYRNDQYMMNIAVLYQNIDYFSDADAMLKQMEQDFPDNYQVYMQKAFLYIDMQSGYANQNRNYSAAVNSYNRAAQLYQNSVYYGNDSQMLMLEGLISDLRANGWI